MRSPVTENRIQEDCMTQCERHLMNVPTEIKTSKFSTANKARNKFHAHMKLVET